MHLAHPSVGHAETGLVHGLLEDELHAVLHLDLRVDRQLVELLHEDVELLGAELVEDGEHALLQHGGLVHGLSAVIRLLGGLLRAGLPGMLGLVQLHLGVRRGEG